MTSPPVKATMILEKPSAAKTKGSWQLAGDDDKPRAIAISTTLRSYINFRLTLLTDITF